MKCKKQQQQENLQNEEKKKHRDNHNMWEQQNYTRMSNCCDNKFVLSQKKLEIEYNQIQIQLMQSVCNKCSVCIIIIQLRIDWKQNRDKNQFKFNFDNWNVRLSNVFSHVEFFSPLSTNGFLQLICYYIQAMTNK